MAIQKYIGHGWKMSQVTWDNFGEQKIYCRIAIDEKSQNVGWVKTPSVCPNIHWNDPLYKNAFGEDQWIILCGISGWYTHLQNKCALWVVKLCPASPTCLYSVCRDMKKLNWVSALCIILDYKKLSICGYIKFLEHNFLVLNWTLNWN